MRYKFLSFVYYEHKKDDFVVPHKHECAELVFYLGGKGVAYIDREKRTFGANSVCVVNAAKKHDEKYFSDSNVYIVKFSTEKALKSFVVDLPQDIAEKVKTLLLKIREESEKKESFYQNICSHLLAIIFYEVKRCKNSNQQESKIQIVENVKQYINENFALAIDFNEIADKYNYSFDRFRHIFVEVEGKTLNQYLCTVRIAKAKEMLEEGSYPIKEIAQTIGFKTAAHFTNFFRSQMGVSPKVYRSVCKNKTDLGVVVFNDASDVKDKITGKPVNK